MKKKDEFTERRRYVRLETVFPIEFQVFLKEKDQAISGLMQGFTRNVSEGGMCLEVNELENGFVNEILFPNNELGLYINIPHKKEPIKARAEVKWHKKIKETFPNKYQFGVEYIHIEDKVRKEIIGYARRLRRRPKIIFASVFLLTIACSILFWQLHNLGIKKGITEKQLLSLGIELTKAHEDRIALENKLYALNIKRQKLEKYVKENKETADSLENKLKKMTNISDTLSSELIAQKTTLEGELTRWRSERESLLRQLDELKTVKESVSEELKRLKDISSKRIVRMRLTNGSSIVGQLIDLTPDRVDIKIGMGSIGIERAMIVSIKEVSTLEKMDMQEEWRRQEEEAKEDEKRYEKFIEAQRQRGLVYFNGRWVKQEEAVKIQEELKKKEEEVFGLIAKQRLETVSTTAKPGLLEKLLEKERKPIISVKDNRIYLNGRLFFIKGIGYGIEYPGTSGSIDTFKKISFSLFEKDFRMMKEAGINTIRTYEPLPEKLLDLAESHGIMVIENVCYPSDNTDFNSRVHLDILKEQARRYVLRDKDRRCILMWSIWNDAPWAWGASGNVVHSYGFNKANNFLKELYNTVKQYDISHPVIAGNAVGLEGERLGWDFLDVIGLNLYIGGYDWYVEGDAKKNIAEIKAIEKEYNKPIVILETGYSTFIKGQDQAEVLEKQIKIAGTNLSGITIFQWADGWAKAGNKDKQDPDIEEYWGIVDGYRNPKSGYNAICKLFNAIPTESYGYSSEENEAL